jgi:hypothetical protein
VASYEVSRLLTLREWRQRRTLTATANGCTMRDELAFEPGWRWTGACVGLGLLDGVPTAASANGRRAGGMTPRPEWRA